MVFWLLTYFLAPLRPLSIYHLTLSLNLEQTLDWCLQHSWYFQKWVHYYPDQGCFTIHPAFVKMPVISQFPVFKPHCHLSTSVLMIALSVFGARPRDPDLSHFHWDFAIHCRFNRWLQGQLFLIGRTGMPHIKLIVGLDQCLIGYARFVP